MFPRLLFLDELPPEELLDLDPDDFDVLDRDFTFVPDELLDLELLFPNLERLRLGVLKYRLLFLLWLLFLMLLPGSMKLLNRPKKLLRDRLRSLLIFTRWLRILDSIRLRSRVEGCTVLLLVRNRVFDITAS